MPDRERPGFGLVWDERCLAHRNAVGAYADGGAPPWLPLIAFERPERWRWS